MALEDEHGDLALAGAEAGGWAITGATCSGRAGSSTTATPGRGSVFGSGPPVGRRQVAWTWSQVPDGSRAVGLDTSRSMLAKASRRTAHLVHQPSFQPGDVTALPFEDASFDACRAETLLQHVGQAQRAVDELARVTRPGGCVGLLDIDLGTVFLDHPDPATTRRILDALLADAAQGWIGRQLPRLLRMAGLVEVRTRPVVVTSGLAFFQQLLAAPAAAMPTDHLDRWWAELADADRVGCFTGGATAFVAAGTKR